MVWRPELARVNVRLALATYDETVMLKKIYRKFGAGVFKMRDIECDCKGQAGFPGKMAQSGYLLHSGKDIDGMHRWRLSAEVCGRFRIDDFILFLPYRMNTAPFSKVKMNRRKIRHIGTTLDREWAYCKTNSICGDVMCKLSEIQSRRTSCVIYQVDWEKCKLWLNGVNVREV